MSVPFTLLSQLNQVPACVVEHSGRYGPHCDWRLRKYHSIGSKALVLCVNIVDRERSKWDAILHQRTLERSYGGVAIGVQQQFGAILFIWCNYRQPFRGSQWDLRGSSHFGTLSKR